MKNVNKNVFLLEALGKYNLQYFRTDFARFEDLNGQFPFIILGRIYRTFRPKNYLFSILRTILSFDLLVGKHAISSPYRFVTYYCIITTLLYSSIIYSTLACKEDRRKKKKIGHLKSVKTNKNNKNVTTIWK